MKKIITFLFFCCVTIVSAQNFTGTWNTTFGEVRLIQEGQHVYGDYNTIGIIDGIQQGNTLNGLFTNNGAVGEFTYTLSSDKKSLSGSWRWQGETTSRGNWTGTLKSSSSPSLRNQKWSGQYTMKCPKMGLEKKVSILQKGFELSGKIDGGGNLSARLKNDLKSLKSGAIVFSGFNLSIFTGYIKSQTSNTITLWYGDMGRTGTTDKNAYTFTYIKPMTAAEFASLTGIPSSSSSTSSTNYNVTSGGLVTSSQPLSSSNGMNEISLENKNPITSIPGRYKVTLTRILFNYSCFDEELNDLEVFGTTGIRCYGKSNNSNFEIKALDNKSPRVMDISSSYPSKIKRFPTKSTGRTRVFDGTKKEWQTYRNYNNKHSKAIKSYDAELIIDRIREFDIRGDFANKNIEFNIQADISEKDPIKNDKFPWSQVSINIEEIELGLEYLLELKIKAAFDFQVAHVAFKIEKY